MTNVIHVFRGFRLLRQNNIKKSLTSTANLGIIQPALPRQALLGQNLVCLVINLAITPNFPTLLRMGFCGKDERSFRLLGAACVVK